MKQEKLDIAQNFFLKKEKYFFRMRKLVNLHSTLLNNNKQLFNLINFVS